MDDSAIRRKIFEQTLDVCIELSNLCGYADMHKACPVHKMQASHTILPAAMVYKVIDTLQKYSYSRKISFHTYNEPLMDPRLFDFVRYARQTCPNSDISITTNGYYLNQTIANELTAAGVTRFFVSAYSDLEYDRINSIKFPVSCKIQCMHLDERLSLYDSPVINDPHPCYAPLTQIIVTADARISLCCLDWKRQYCFGDLNKQSFESAMQDPQMLAVYDRLSKGDRCLEICKRCNWSRGKKIQAGDNCEQNRICDTPQVKIPEPVIVTGKGGTQIRIDIVEDLAEFTTLPPGVVEELIIQSRNLKGRCYNARSEFSDCMARQNSDHWFYLGSRYFIFENAKHATDIAQSIKTLLPEGGRIWEFGGGCGNISMTLAALGYDVTFSELSSLQKDFLRFRAHRHGLKIRILDSWEKPPQDEFDLVLAIDVLEHIPEYKEILEQLCDSVKTGGIIFETSAFEKDSTNVTHHIPDKYDYRRIMSQHGLNLIYGVSVGRLWKKPAGLDRAAGSETRQMQTGQANDFQWFFGRGLEEVGHGDYTLSLDYFQDAWEVNQAGFESIFKSEISKLKAEQFELLAKTAAQCLNESKENLNHAAKLICGPLEAPKYVKAGMSQLKAGNLSGALENFNKASELDGTIPNVHYTLAVLLSKHGRYGAAKTSCLEQLRYEPQHSQAKEMIDKLDRAIAEFDSINVESQR